MDMNMKSGIKRLPGWHLQDPEFRFKNQKIVLVKCIKAEKTTSKVWVCVAIQ